jgi:hypothetical protein
LIKTKPNLDFNYTEDQEVLNRTYSIDRNEENNGNSGQENEDNLDIILRFKASNDKQYKFLSQTTANERSIIQKVAQRQGLLTKLVGGRYKYLYAYKTNLEFTITQTQRTSQALDQLTNRPIPVNNHVQEVVDAEIASAQQATNGRKRGRSPKAATQPEINPLITQTSEYNLRKIKRN